MKVVAIGIFSLVLLSAAPAKAPLGPHPYPMPGAVVEEFPLMVHAWHAFDRGNPEADLHSSSHIYLKGPDGKWVDGTVHVGEVVGIIAEYPERLPEGEYSVWSNAHWKTGDREHGFDWTFTFKKPAKKEKGEPGEEDARKGDAGGKSKKQAR